MGKNGICMMRHARTCWLAGTRMSLFWIVLELRVTEVVATTEANRCAKTHSKCHHQQTNTSFYTLDALPVVQPTVSEH